MTEARQDAPVQSPAQSSRWRRRLAVRILGGIVLLLLLLAGVGYWYISTPEFADKVRLKLIAVLEQSTGGRVELGAFHWQLRKLAFEADDLTIHGLEAASEVPYAHVDRLYVRLKWGVLIHPKIKIAELDIDHPVIHLIVYPDGSTNQPQPKTQSGNPRGTINTIFDLQAGQVSAWNGVVLFNERSVPFTFMGRDLSLLVRYLKPSDQYALNLNVADITTTLQKMPDVHSQLTGELQLGRNLAQIKSLEWKTLRSGLTITGQVENYLAPVMNVEIHGKADLRDVAYLTGERELAGGVAHLDMKARGSSLSDLQARGMVRLKDGAYHDENFQIRDVSLETPFIFTGKLISATDVRADAAGGVILHGAFSMTNWQNQNAALRGKTFPKATEPHAEFSGDVQAVVLPQVLRSALSPRYSELGFNSLVTGHGEGGWVGNPRGVFVTAKVDLAPLDAPNGVPLSGTVDATYTGVNDFVAVRTLQLKTPASTLQAEGTLDVGLENSRTALRADATTTNLAELNPVLAMAGVGAKSPNPSSELPVQLHGEAAFHGEVDGPLQLLRVAGNLDVINFSTVFQTAANQRQVMQWDALHTSFDLSPSAVSVASMELTKGSTTVRADATLTSAHLHAPYQFDRHAQVRGTAQIQNASIPELAAIAGKTNVPVTGTLTLEARLNGSLDDLQGTGKVTVKGGEIEGEPYKSLTADLVATHSYVGASKFSFSQNGGKINGSGGYDLQAKTVQANVTGSGFELAHIQKLQRGPQPVGGALDFHLEASGDPASPDLQGHITLKNASLGREQLGSLDANVHTQSHVAFVDATSDLLRGNFQLHGQVAMQGDYNAQATLSIANVDAQPLLTIFVPKAAAIRSTVHGTVTLAGPLKTPKLLDIDAALDTFQMTYAPYKIQNEGPLKFSLHHGLLRVDAFHITGPETDFSAHGTAEIYDQRALDMDVKGAFNLAELQSFNKNLVSSGHADLSLEARGTMDDPQLHGQVAIVNGTVADIDFPNGLSQLNGDLEFNEDRLEIRKLTGVTGGGTVSAGGFLTYEQGFYADVTLTGKDVRVRYPAGISSTANASLRLQGSPQQATLTGNILLTKFGILGGLGVGGGGATAIQAPPDPAALSSHVLLDVHLTSAPELDFENSYASLAGQVDLRIRGSVAAPSVLGRVVITEGSATLAGTPYQLQRGLIYFANPVRIDPVIDLDATATVRDYDISLGVHGTLEKLSTSYRSEPPLPQADIIALLALGRTQEQAQIYQQEQSDAGVDSTTNALLGGALNATVSNRVQKLFGVGQVKIDPNFVGSLGQSTARVTVTQQVSKAVTLTYATNVNETSQQLIQAQIAISRDLSLVAARDEAGVFSLLFKIRQRRR
jgi:translocation and assembly module TamB